MKIETKFDVGDAVDYRGRLVAVLKVIVSNELFSYDVISIQYRVIDGHDNIFTINEKDLKKDTYV